MKQFLLATLLITMPIQVLQNPLKGGFDASKLCNDAREKALNRIKGK